MIYKEYKTRDSSIIYEGGRPEFCIEGRLDKILQSLANKAGVKLIIPTIEREAGLAWTSYYYEPMVLVEILAETYGYVLIKDENIYRVTSKVKIAGFTYH